jgi:lysozyme
MNLEARIKQHEGLRTHPYVDTQGKLTIGVGHNLTDNGLPDHIIDLLLEWDIDIARQELDRIHPDWRKYSPNRKDCLVELLFNMGAPALMTFKKMWAAIEREDWREAAVQLLDSRWAEQVGPDRSSTLADLLEDELFQD